MTRLHAHPERHAVSRIGWLRAAVLGANDGIVSTASLIIGVAAAAAKPSDILIAGTTGLVADRLGRNAILCELNPEYVEIARKRISAEQGMFQAIEVAA